ncbi:MAG: dihydrolipoyl dehydrogenase [Granulosicoccaceae bacterium]
MSELKTIQVPDIGDADSVEIIEVLISDNQQLSIDDSLITVESDKASMEIPSPVAGTVTSVLVKPGDKVSAGSDILVMAINDTNDHTATEAPAQDTTSAPAKPKTNTFDSDAYDVVVIGAGPGGYTAAFRAADLGLNVALIERYESLGGVCLNVGCIPSKALLHTAAVIDEAKHLEKQGISFAEPSIDIDKLRSFKESVVGQLTNGLKGMAKQRKVTVLTGNASFESNTAVAIESSGATQSISFKNAIIAAGSQSVKIPGFPYDDERMLDSTRALELQSIPDKLLIIGGGIIGLEMGCVYAALGTKITVVELSDQLMPGCDADLLKPLQQKLSNDFEAIYTGSKVTKVEAAKNGLTAFFEGGKAPATEQYDKVLLAVGRSPNGLKLNATAAGVEVTERGYINVDQQQRTNVTNIFAIGDIVGQPMLAHKATHEGKVAAEVCAGKKSFFDARTIPSVAYTDPEVSWMGLTETDAKANGVEFEKASFPWAASGRNLSMGSKSGLTKILFDPNTKKILGAGIVGKNAGELIAEAVLALEMGADIEDLALTIHPHPTLSETLNFAAEVAEGTVTDIYLPKKRKR